MVTQMRPAGPAQDANPHLADMTGVPMTPAMNSLHELAKLAYDLDVARGVVADLILDATLLSLAEGQTQRSVIIAQGREFGWRSQLRKLILRKRNINIVSQEHYRERSRTGLPPEEVPSYLSDASTSTLAAAAKMIAQTATKLEEHREKQYPAIHTCAKTAIEGETDAQAS